MLTTRRSLMGLSAGLAAAGMLSRAGAVLAQPAYGSGALIRQDVNTLAPDDPVITTYRETVAAMQALPDTDPRSWAHQARIHLGYCPHGNWFFLPWHRAYLAQFEEVIRGLSGDDSFVLPYWDWSRNPQIPAPFWGSGNALNHPRTATASTNMTAEFVGLDVIEVIMEKTDFEDFGSLKASAPFGGTGGGTTQLEGSPHNSVHGTIGGDMQSFLSPLDPIFWLHHCNIDRIWASWNAAGNANSADPDLAAFTFAPDQPDRGGTVNPSQFVDRTGAPRAFTVQDIYTTASLNYDYDRLEPTPQSNVLVAARSFAPRAELAETVSTALTQRAAAGEFLGARVTADADRLGAVAQLGRLRDLARNPAQRVALPARLQTARLVIRGLLPPEDRQTTFRVFLNCDYLSVETPPNDPHYVGSGAFFLASDHAARHGSDYQFDLAATLDALARAGRPVDETLRPQIIALAPDGSGAELEIDGTVEIVLQSLG
ncbi:tyrosinase family protein [Puniceibacterium confluentis]|uniref:tyrosinase family protein n=1 Tax=Puniceibacterium confluentis TaxID=1958944 RepID=UPI0011B819F0|nr:tyrosinase family protein [Puniceibacterium confluentis]